MGKTITLRRTAISQKVIDYIDSKVKKGANLTQTIVDLLETGLSILSGQEGPSLPQRVKRGESIDTHQIVKRGDRILLPCLRTNRWVHPKLDCEGCHVKCSLTTDHRLLIEGLMLNTRS